MGFCFRGALLRVLGRRGLEFWGSCVWCLRGLSLGPEGSGVWGVPVWEVGVMGLV